MGWGGRGGGIRVRSLKHSRTWTCTSLNVYRALCIRDLRTYIPPHLSASLRISLLLYLPYLSPPFPSFSRSAEADRIAVEKGTVAAHVTQLRSAMQQSAQRAALLLDRVQDLEGLPQMLSAGGGMKKKADVRTLQQLKVDRGTTASLARTSQHDHQKLAEREEHQASVYWVYLGVSIHSLTTPCCL